MRVKHIENGNIVVSNVEEIYKRSYISSSGYYLCIAIMGTALRYKMPEEKIDELIDKMFETGRLDMTSYERIIGAWG